LVGLDQSKVHEVRPLLHLFRTVCTKKDQVLVQIYSYSFRMSWSKALLYIFFSGDFRHQRRFSPSAAIFAIGGDFRHRQRFSQFWQRFSPSLAIFANFLTSHTSLTSVQNSMYQEGPGPCSDI